MALLLEIPGRQDHVWGNAARYSRPSLVRQGGYDNVITIMMVHISTVWLLCIRCNFCCASPACRSRRVEFVLALCRIQASAPLVSVC